MGYRCQVRLIITSNGFEKLKKANDDALSKYRNKGENVWSLLDVYDFKKEDKENQMVYMGWDWVKFYDTFPEVDSFRFALNQLKEKEIPYQFLRIGEDPSDIEEEYTLQLLECGYQPYSVNVSIDGGIR